MNTADQSRPPKMSLFPKVALWTLDIFCVLIVVVGVFVVTDDLIHSSAKNLESAIATFIMQLLFLLFFWIAHLLIRRTLAGNPFDRRNVRLIYVLSGLVIFASVVNGLDVSRDVITHVYQEKGKEVKKVDPPHWTFSYGKKYEDGFDFFLQSGVLYGFALLGFGAIFQRGVELREEEERLRAEQALTV